MSQIGDPLRIIEVTPEPLEAPVEEPVETPIEAPAEKEPVPAKGTKRGIIMKRVIVLLLVVLFAGIPTALAVQDCPPWDPDCNVQHGPDPVEFPYPSLEVGNEHAYVPVVRALLYQHGFGGLEDLSSTVFTEEMRKDVARYQWLWMRQCTTWQGVVSCNHDGFEYGAVNLATLQSLMARIRITGG